jgi:hypothetical protein
VLHIALALFCSEGCAKLSLQNIEYNCAQRLLILHSPQEECLIFKISVHQRIPTKRVKTQVIKCEKYVQYL